MSGIALFLCAIINESQSRPSNVPGAKGNKAAADNCFGFTERQRHQAYNAICRAELESIPEADQQLQKADIQATYGPSKYDKQQGALYQVPVEENHTPLVAHLNLTRTQIAAIRQEGEEKRWSPE